MMPASMPHLHHLQRLTDPRGLIHAAIGDCPDRSRGYDSIDNADALRLCALGSDTVSADVLNLLAGTYFNYLTRARREDGRIHHACDAGGRWQDGGDEALVQSRLARALAAVLVSELPIRMRLEAAQWWARLLPWSDAARTPVSAGNWLIAIGTLRYADPGRDLARVESLARWLLDGCYDAARTADWQWFETCWTPGAACIADGLWHASLMLDDPRLADVARTTTRFIREHLFSDRRLCPVGTRGGWDRQGARACFDQLPAEATSLLELFATAERIDRDPVHREAKLQAAAWFTGENLLGVDLIDQATGGCYDAIRADGLDRNQGAAATVACLLAQAALSDPQPVELTFPPQMVIG